MCDAGPMAQIVCPLVSFEDRARLETIVGDRNRAQKHVARARILLGSADRLPVAQIARRAGVGRPAVWRWQRRFAEAGVDGLLRDATRKPGKPRLDDATVHRVVALTCTEAPGEATHWTGRAMAKTARISLPRCSGSGAHTGCSLTALGPSSARTIPSLPPSSRTSSACTSNRRRTAWCSRSMRKAKFRPWIGPSRACRSSLARPAP